MFWGACRLTDINTHCLAEFRKHWECLDNRNQQLWQCRPAEWKLNKCVYDNLVRLNFYPMINQRIQRTPRLLIRVWL